MSLSAVFSQMAVLFIVLAVGFAINKFKILTAESNRLLSKLVINVAMPCTILGSVMSGSVTATGSEAAFFMLMVLASFAIAFLLSAPLPRLLRAKKDDKGLLRFMVAFGNVGFMGFPIVGALFGTGALFYVTLLNIPFSILAFSVGIIMVSGKNKKINPKLFINPSLIASIIAVIIFYAKIPMPTILTDTTKLIGQLTTPSAMLVIGSTLAAIPFKEVFREVRIYPVALVKLVIFPVLTWLVLKPFISDPLMLGVLVTLAAMPTAANATMLAMEYGGNETLASKGVFLTTLFSVATIPLLIFFLIL